MFFRESVIVYLHKHYCGLILLARCPLAGAQRHAYAPLFQEINIARLWVVFLFFPLTSEGYEIESHASYSGSLLTRQLCSLA